MRKKFFMIVGAVVFFFLFPSLSYAVSDLQGIEAGGMRIHNILITVGKWVIIIKGTIDCIQSIMAGDVQTARKQFMGYLMCFAIILILPWGLNEIEAIFQ